MSVQVHTQEGQSLEPDLSVQLHPADGQVVFPSPEDPPGLAEVGRLLAALYRSAHAAAHRAGLPAATPFPGPITGPLWLSLEPCQEPGEGPAQWRPVIYGYSWGLDGLSLVAQVVDADVQLMSDEVTGVLAAPSRAELAALLLALRGPHGA